MLHEEKSIVRMHHYLHNKRLFTNEFLTTNDVTLSPSLGVLESREDAKIHPFIFSSPMDTVTGTEMVKALSGLGHFPVVCRFTAAWRETFDWWMDNNQPSNVWFSIGAGKKCGLLEWLDDFADSIRGMNIAVDVAHGDSVVAHTATKDAFRRDYVLNVMSGTVCTPEGAIRAIKSGSNYIRVGVGPGSVCTTRLMTGFGLPNLSSVYNIDQAIRDFVDSASDRNNYFIVADGGIKHPGDAVKYITAGADGIMLGSELSRTYESDGWETDNFGRQVKRYRGQASASFQKDLLGRTPKCAEGATGPVITPVETVKELVNRYVGGMQSAISYAGVTSMSEMNTNNVRFERITNSGWTEGTPHGTT